MNLYTGDLHFGHKNVIQFDHRPFSNVEEMDAFIMQCWNKRVQPDDIMKKKERALNAGCMINNYSPASLIELVRNNTVFQEK